jgi:redox-sensitive bicupin YhaK (pirin superfamily)
MFVLQRGAVLVNEAEPMRGVELAVFDRIGDRITIECRQDARALLLAGEPIGEEVVGQGPFVMNTREEIRQAMLDYQSGAMGSLATEN